jgi:hypothetical protein
MPIDRGTRRLDQVNVVATHGLVEFDVQLTNPNFHKKGQTSPKSLIE